MVELSVPPVILFDGVCNVCNAAVNFVIDRDPRARFRFAALQSDYGRKLCGEHGIGPDILTIVLVEDGKAYTESTAALRIARSLQTPWPLVYGFIAVPRFLRDAAYRFFAANRYRWFGQRDQCRVPTPDIRRRFLTQ
jgi:predicted DCC family thiol-disulfide oxidoreductase YuxK